MIQIIAEVGDKIPSVWLYWIAGTFLAGFAYSLSYAFKFLAVVVIGIGLLGLRACSAEFMDGDLGLAVRQEMGTFYVFFAAFVPSGLTITGALIALILVRLKPPKIGQCACGYCLQGNTSGICPECGKTTPRDLPASIT